MPSAKFDGKWTKDLITGKRKRTAADNSFLENNDKLWIRLLKGASEPIIWKAAVLILLYNVGFYMVTAFALIAGR